MDITVVLNAHHEGDLALASCRSIEASRADAEKEGIAVEVVVIVDRPNPETIKFFARNLPKDWKKTVVDFGDPGRSRNAGVRMASGSWIAFLDADDLFGINWLRSAFRAAEQRGQYVVWHPEINVYFGEEERIHVHVDMEARHFQLAGLLPSNYWTALCFTSRELLLETPYPDTHLNRQIGYEDWAWNLEAIAHGAIHKIVPRTGHCIRVKRFDSVLKDTNSAACIPRPSTYFRQQIVNHLKTTAISGAVGNPNAKI